MIDITLLGSGATMPTPERGLSAAILRCSGRSILFDCGEGTQVALRRAKASAVKIDLIALTHYHGDHIFGLPGLLQTISCLGRTDPLYITGPAGLEEAMRLILQLAGPTSYEIHLLCQEEASSIALAKIHAGWPPLAELLPFPTAHRIDSSGYVFRLPRLPALDLEMLSALGIPTSMWKPLQLSRPDRPVLLNEQPLIKENGDPVLVKDLTKWPRKGLVVVFSGDTMPCDGTRRHAENADLLIHDATYPSSDHAEEAAKWGHTTFLQAARLARDVGAKRLWLTHYSQIISSPEAYLPATREIFPPVECGYDGKSVSLSFQDRELP